MRQHLLLVGLPGSGKSAAGRIAAATLRARFVDVDQVIEEQERLPISRIFAERGEAAFRELERRQVRSILADDPCVVVPGGGWAAQSGNLEEAGRRALIVYLRAAPEVAASRAAPQGNRPLLACGDPVARMRELLARRGACYEAADAVVDTAERTTGEVGAALVALARSKAGW